MMNIEKIRKDFPILDEKVNNHPLVYFDNAATTHKPALVVDEIIRYYQHFNSNIHRGTHHLSVLATQAFEETRAAIKKFINAKENHEIIFTKGTTESINLVAQSFCDAFTNAGDEIIVTNMEHHSNFVPWQMNCIKRGLKFKVVEVEANGMLDLDKLTAQFTENTKLLAIAHVSNVLGTINPIKEIIERAHKYGVKVLIDGAQGIAHANVDVQALDCDFYCFSGHKMYGPTGVGILYGKEELLNLMPPYQFGGEMIANVSLEKTTFNALPYKFEAGTPNIAAVIALKKAIEYLENIGMENIAHYETALLNHLTEKLSAIENITIYGNSLHKSAVVSFNIKNIHHADLGMLLDAMGVAVRTGHHCAEPLMSFFSQTGMARASLAVYNTFEEIDLFESALNKAIKMLS